MPVPYPWSHHDARLLSLRPRRAFAGRQADDLYATVQCRQCHSFNLMPVHLNGTRDGSGGLSALLDDLELASKLSREAAVIDEAMVLDTDPEQLFDAYEVTDNKQRLKLRAGSRRMRMNGGLNGSGN